MKAAVIQSSFLPWKGYFDIINEVDVFVFYDCVQFTKSDWRTRNYVKTPRGRELIKINVHGSIHRTIDEIAIDNKANWKKRLLKTFDMNYSRAPFFREYRFLLDFIDSREWNLLTDFNRETTVRIAGEFGIKTHFVNSTDLDLSGRGTDRLIDALGKVGADYYLSGPSAKSYLEPDKMQEAGIRVEFKKYDYPEYPQLWGDFIHEVTVLDVIFNIGPKAAHYIHGWKEKTLRSL